MVEGEAAQEDAEVCAPAPVQPVPLQEEVIRLDSDDVLGAKQPGDGQRKQARSREPRERPHHMDAALRKFTRPGVDRAALQEAHKDLRKRLGRQDVQDQEAAFLLAKGEVLQTAERGFLQAEDQESTTQFTQAELLGAAPVGVARKCFSFDVPYGPYACSYTANGQYLLVGGQKGQVAFLQCETMQISTELQLKETVRAVQTLHNHTIFATAQKKYVHMYDNTGLELHCLRENSPPLHLDFLPYHYLLVIAGEHADLRYRDISTGQEVCVHKTRLGPSCCLRHNPKNAVVHAGHSNGLVTLWTPNVKEPVVKMLAHSGRVTCVAVHDNYMASSGADGWWKVWDLRKYEALRSTRSYGHAVSDIDVSMTGLVALGFGSHLQVWKDAFGAAEQRQLYMTEEYPGRSVTSVRFRPYEDVCGVGHTGGFAAIIVPGAGFANFDSFEANPFETKRQRREKEVRSLLEKLQPDSIMLEPHIIGDVDKDLGAKYKEAAKKHKEEEASKKKKKVKKKMRGKGKIGNVMKRKHLQELKVKRTKMRARVEAEAEDGQGESKPATGDSSDEEVGSEVEEVVNEVESTPAEHPKRYEGALGRFYGKRRRRT